MKHKTIYIPTLTGTYITLIELSRLAKMSYTALFHYQKEISLIPSFKIEGFYNARYKQNESLQILEKFKKLRSNAKGNKNFLKEIKSELLQDETYQLLQKLSEQHKAEIEERF